LRGDKWLSLGIGTPTPTLLLLGNTQIVEELAHAADSDEGEGHGETVEHVVHGGSLQEDGLAVFLLEVVLDLADLEVSLLDLLLGHGGGPAAGGGSEATDNSLWRSAKCAVSSGAPGNLRNCMEVLGSTELWNPHFLSSEG